MKKEFFTAVLGMVVLWLTIILMILSCGGRVAILNFIDMPSVLYVLLSSYMVLVISGLWKDFWKAFPLTWREEEMLDVVQVKKCILAVKTEMRALILCGPIMSCVGLVVTLRQLSSPEMLGPLMAITILSLFYGFLFNLFLVPVKTRLERKLLEE